MPPTSDLQTSRRSLGRRVGGFPYLISYAFGPLVTSTSRADIRAGLLLWRVRAGDGIGGASVFTSALLVDALDKSTTGVDAEAAAEEESITLVLGRGVGGSSTDAVVAVFGGCVASNSSLLAAGVDWPTAASVIALAA